MGYTHYWTQRRDFSKPDWTTVCADIGQILAYAQGEKGIKLGDGAGDFEYRDRDYISFNGYDEDAHETFFIPRIRPPYEAWQKVRGRDFCKTARKPYDVVVTACLSYLATVQETHHVTSDGRGDDWVTGVELARLALPKYANILDVPMPIMQEDRWCMPWIDNRSSSFEVHFCVDGHGYVLRPKTGESHRFDTHQDLATFLFSNRCVEFKRGGNPFQDHRFGYGPTESNIWNPTGSFDQARWNRIGRAQTKVLSRLFPGNNIQPPALIRPGMRPDLNNPYWYSDFFKEKVA